MNEPLEKNRAVWNSLVPFHLGSRFYDVPAVLAGRCSLRPLERDLVGQCVGMDLLHLQCHFGLDSLSWARLGANVTGVDFSPAAIEAARGLCEAAGVSARFICDDVQQLKFDAQFDVGVTSYGVLCWLEDLRAWADGVYRALRPGGQLVLVEFHPMLEAVFPGKMTGALSYFGSPKPAAVDTTGTYADRSAAVAYTEYRWQHPISKVVSALSAAGFHIATFDEYPYCSFGLFDELQETAPGMWSPDGRAIWPYMFSVRAIKRVGR